MQTSRPLGSFFKTITNGAAPSQRFRPIFSLHPSMSLHKSELSTKDAEKGTSDDVHSVSDIGHVGVKTVQATHKVYGKYSKWFLFIG